MADDLQNLQNIPDRLLLIAGDGTLPCRVQNEMQKYGRSVLTFFIGTNPHPGLEIAARFSLLNPGDLIARAKQSGIRDVLCVGAVKRPALKHVRLSVHNMVFLFQNRHLFMGDDVLLKKIRRFVEAQGFHLWRVQDIVPKILCPQGHVTYEKNNVITLSAHRFFHMLKEIGRLDIGQAMVVQGDRVLGVEAAEGTDALIKRCGVLAQSYGEKPILIKAAKPGQDDALDMPTVGLETVRDCIDQGYAGMILESGAVLLAQLDEMIHLAEEHRFFIYGATTDNTNCISHKKVECPP